MELMQCILARRSGRKYTSEDIPEEALNQILEAGLLSPSSRNLKSTELITVSDPGMLAQLSRVKAGRGAMLKDANRAIVVIGNSTASDAWIEDGSIAMTQMMLRSAELGIANCWVHCRNRYSDQPGADGMRSADELVKELLGIPETYSVLAILSLGMPADSPKAHTKDEADWGKIHIGSF